MKFAYNYHSCICLELFCRLNSIAEINDDKETLKVVVRLINMWTIPRSRKFTIELILVDKKVRLIFFFFGYVYLLVVVSCLQQYFCKL